jgi:hypothetical protein
MHAIIKTHLSEGDREMDHKKTHQRHLSGQRIILATGGKIQNNRHLLPDSM